MMIHHDVGQGPAGVWPPGMISLKFTVMVAIIRTNVTTVVNSATYFKQNLSLRLELRLELQGILETFEVIQENNHLYGSERIK